MFLLLSACAQIAANYGAPADPADPTELIVEIPAGTSARTLGPLLEAQKVVESGEDFTLYVRLTKEGGCLKAGRFKLRRNMGAAEILKTVCGVPLPEDIPFTVVEGWRIREIDAALAAKGWTQPGEYAALAANPTQFKAAFPLPEATLEGYLFPETYMVIPEKWSTQDFMQRQLDLFAERFYLPNKAAIESNGKGLADLVIMASMLEKEEPTKDQRPLVAGILWKRIGASWNLGVDATSRYTLEDWNDRKAFLKQLRDPSDPYNTRLRPGLPPTPISNPGLTALTAALAPTESEYWYYLHDEKKIIHPARDEAEHERNRATYNVY